MTGYSWSDRQTWLWLVWQRYPQMRLVVLTMIENPAILQALWVKARPSVAPTAHALAAE